MRQLPALLLAVTCLSSLSATSNAAGCASQPVQGESEAVIRQLDQKWSQAYWTGDTAFLECLYAANFESADSKGELTTRTQDIAGALKNVGKSWTYDPQKYDTKVFMHPHTAVVTFFKGDSAHGYRGTDIYEYDHGRWHAVYSQSSKY
jgi:hypothetical protein